MAANSNIAEEVAYWKKRFEDMEAKISRLDGGEAAVAWVRWHPVHGYRWDSIHSEPYKPMESWRCVPLYTRPAPPAMVDGWKLVPIEPTEEMVAAAMRLPDALSLGDEWKAMLAAAPTPPAAAKGDL